MIEWQVGDLVANGIQTHYARSGGGKPPLILLHGATDNGMCWEPVARRLAADFDVVLPDARGHGQSSAPPQGYSSAERAADVADLIAKLGLGRPVVGGHSMGGLTTLRLAADHPDLVRCAILEDPPLRAANQPRTDGERWRSDMARMKRMTREELIAMGRRDRSQWSADELPAWADAKQQVSEAFMNSLGRTVEPPWQDLVARLRCPTLLITADPARGAIVSADSASEAARLTPNLEVVHLEGAGHNIRRERFDGFMEAVTALLARERITA